MLHRQGYLGQLAASAHPIRWSSHNGYTGINLVDGEHYRNRADLREHSLPLPSGSVAETQHDQTKLLRGLRASAETYGAYRAGLITFR
jgi:hypothetical protein